MNDADDLMSRTDVFGRYALPGNRYKKLMGGRFVRMSALERDEFGKALASDARSIPDEKLGQLFSGDWREQLTGAWLAGVAKRIEFRKIIAERIIEGDRFAGKGHSFSLARFGGPIDADVLSLYLRQYLLRVGRVLAQPWALGALMLLDSQLATNRADEFIADDGPWKRWVEGGEAISYTPTGMMELIRSWCDFADGFNEMIG